MDDAASSSSTDRRRPRPKVSPVKRILGLLRRLTGFAMDLREAARERADAEAAKAEAGGNGDPYFMDSLLDFRLHHLIQRLIGLTARFELRRMSERGKARANAPGAAEKRKLAAQKRAEAKAAFVKETGLDVRYMPLERPLGQEPPPRRSRWWQRLQQLASVIDGVDDATVLREACAEMAALAQRLGLRDTGAMVALVENRIADLMTEAAKPETPEPAEEQAPAPEPEVCESG